jgi:hypothetical protein
MLLVVHDGRAYLVPVERPQEFTRPPVNPVLEVLPFPDLHRLVLASHTRLVGLGPDGVAWTTDDLASDGFDEIRPTSQGIAVSAYLPSGERAEHLVDVQDGHLD